MRDALYLKAGCRISESESVDHAIAKRRNASHFNTASDLIEAIEEGAILRVRPKAMRHGLRGHAQNRSSHGRRNDHRANALNAGAAGGLSAATAARYADQIDDE